MPLCYGLKIYRLTQIMMVCRVYLHVFVHRALVCVFPFDSVAFAMGLALHTRKLGAACCWHPLRVRGFHDRMKIKNCIFFQLALNWLAWKKKELHKKIHTHHTSQNAKAITPPKLITVHGCGDVGGKKSDRGNRVCDGGTQKHYFPHNEGVQGGETHINIYFPHNEGVQALVGETAYVVLLKPIINPS